MEFLLLGFLILHPFVGYFAAFIGMIVEGEFILFAAAFLTHLGLFNFGGMLAVIYSGVILGDALWYIAGANWNRLPERFQKIAERLAIPFDYYIKNQPFLVIFATKFVMGVHHFFLLRAGTLRVPFARFIMYDIIASAGWIALVGGLGYLSSYSLLPVKQYLHFGEAGLLIALLLFFFLEKIIKKLFKKEQEILAESGRIENKTSIQKINMERK